jgi:hypothetical protein
MKTSDGGYNFFNTGRRRTTILFAALLVTGVVLLTSTKASAQDSSIRTRFAPTESTTERRVFVRSKSALVRGAVVEEKLLKRAEFSQLRLVITRDAADADIILELRHDLLTKYVWSVVDTKTQTVLAGGKVSSLGGTVAGKVAKRFVKEMARIRMP